MTKKGVVKEVYGDHIKVQVYKKNSCGNCKTCTEGGRYSQELVIKTNKKFFFTNNKNKTKILMIYYKHGTVSP